MIAAARHKDFGLYGACATAPARDTAAKKPGILRRMIDAIYESHERQADREIARILNRSGGRLTDDMEREIMQRLSPRNWSVPE